MKHQKPLLLVILLLTTALLQATDESDRIGSDIHYAGLGHIHLSAVQSDSAYTPYGFRLRRLDLRMWESRDVGLEWSVLVGFSDFKFKILEADIGYAISPGLKFRIGQFIPPGARSGISMDFRYSAVTMPFVERSMVTLNWVGHSRLNAYRTFGLLMHGDVLQERLYYALMFATPDGSHFFYPSNRQSTHDNTLNGYALWGRLEYDIQEDFNVGGFFNTRTINSGQEEAYSYGTHVMYSKDGLRLMSEYIAGQVTPFAGAKQTYHGAFAEVSKRWESLEPALRYDYYSPYNGSADPMGITSYHNFTTGINYYATDVIRVQCNYLTKLEKQETLGNYINNNIFYVNLQFFLKK